MAVRPGCKQTEVGIIPDDWNAVELEAVCSMRSGEVITATKLDDFSEYPCYGGNGLRGYTSRFTHEGRFALIGRQGALCGNVVGAEGKFFASEHAVVVTPRPGTDIAFLTYVLGQMRLNRYSESSAQPGLSVSKVLKLPLAVPPIESEQRAIASALSDVDALLDGLDRLIAKKRDIKQAAMQQLLTGQTRLPGFHGEWETVRVADISDFITKGSTPTTYGFGWQSSGVLFLRSECVSPRGLDLTESMFISAKAHQMLHRSAVHSNDLLITITGNVGRVVRLPGDFGEANINQHIARIRIVDEATHPGWVYHFLSQPVVRQHFEKITTGQAYPQISLVQVRNAVIARPAFGEQQEISAVFDDMDAELAALEARRDKTRALKQGMMQELLTGRTRLV